MSNEECDDHSFPEEREPSGRLILAPCLTCGMSAGDGMQSLKEAIERETFARVTADCASELARDANTSLLEACKAAEEHFSGTDAPLGALLRAAIAKAEGR